MCVHYDCTNLTMNQLMNLDKCVRYKYCLDIFPIYYTNNEFNSPYSNIDSNTEVHKWHSEGSKLNFNIFNVNENNFCFNNIDPHSNCWIL